MEYTDTVVSGIRPTGEMHIGNLFGALLPCVELARNPANRCFFFSANLHALTTGIGEEAAGQMQDDLPNLVLDFLAAGIDHEAPNVRIYAQSSIPEISELTWILGCLTSIRRLLGMPQFEEKQVKLLAAGLRVSLGLGAYPVLMAADILALLATLVPVGADQTQHLELARHLARVFNNAFQPGFFPEPVGLEGQRRVPGLQGDGKMGKSDSEANETIILSDPTQVVRKKVLRADKRLPGSEVDPRIGDEPGNPMICRVHLLHEQTGVSTQELAEVEAGCRDGSLRCGDCKVHLADHLEGILGPFRERRRALEAAGGTKLAIDILHEHGKQVRAIVAPTVEEVKRLVGTPTY